ncbi:protein transport protein sec73 [Phyllosticta citriasiana]|uniref:Protein transport protein sec73 n=1 Tax=Phyllosticta citriasiana TaxID=595635 RepID=A0ABR1KKX2_9PEZI
MPLRGLRPGKSEKDLKRRSTLDPASLLKRSDPASHTHSAENLPSSDRGIKSSDGIRPALQPRPSLPEGEVHRPISPPVQDHNPMTRRFSMLRSRHASDPQLRQKAKDHKAAAQATDVPPVPPVPPLPAAPAIITTAPTLDMNPDPPPKKKTKFPTFKSRLSTFDVIPGASPRRSLERKRSAEFARGEQQQQQHPRPSREDPRRLSTSRARDAPATNGDDAHAGKGTGSAGRLSDSSRSDGSYGDHGPFGFGKRPQLTSTSSIFRLPRRNKDHNRKSLFPLPVKIPAPPEFPDTAPATPRASTSGASYPSPHHSPNGTYSPPLTAVHRSNTDGSAHPGQSPSHSALASVVNASEQTLNRNDSTTSARSARSSPSLAPPARLNRRGRSSTMGSLGAKSDEDDSPTPPLGQTGRSSTSTTGRTSFSNLFSLGKLRHNTEPHSPRHGSPGHHGPSGRGSYSTSLNISRETLEIPPREEGEAPGRYLERLEQRIDRSLIAAIMAQSGDEFSSAVLRSYMRRFMFFGDPVDMALRKLLMEVTLPKETQQIDRVLQGFADRYHECNPGIFVSPEEAYFISFSIVLLNSDFFNPNNKRKMQKPDYIKNCNGSNASEVNEDVLATIYDNIVYTQFIHIDDDVDLRSTATRRNKKNLIKHAVQDPVKKAQKEPIDPYTLIFENKLDVLRPPIKDVMQFEDPYSYRGTSQTLDLKMLHRTFARYGVIQIMSARSRPDAFMSPTTIENPDGAQAGVVEMPVTKVGILWRKDTKRRAARSPWQEWGAILTRSGLSFFKNAAWVKSLIHQHDIHEQKSQGGAPVIFKPPVPEFKADYAIPMDQCVAALDNSYKKHKYAFAIFAKGGAEEVFLADNEADMNDWLAKLNYTAAFETAGIRPRVLTGSNYEGQRARAIRSSHSSMGLQTPTGDVTITSGKIDNQLAQEITKARRVNIQRKVEETEDKLGAAVKQLDNRLRDARHLQVMAPIQPRTREHVMHAAGRMAAKLKWIRIEICRMKAHRDILIMDLDEEKRAAGEPAPQEVVSAAPNSSGSSPTIQGSKPIQTGLKRLGSRASASTTRPMSPSNLRPGTAESEQNDDDVFTTPPETSQNSPGIPQNGWGIPAINLDVPSADQTNGLEHRPSVSTIGDGERSELSSETGSRHRRPSTSEADKHGLDGARPSTPNPNAETPQRPTATGTPESRNKVRRSLHRTLRDTHSSSNTPGHRRSGKGKDSSSTMSDDTSATSPTSPEVLPRSHHSFTVHGKKASVVTFGAEWQNLSAEERLKLRKATLEDGTMSGGGSGRAVGPEGRSGSSGTGFRQRAASTDSAADTIRDQLVRERSLSETVAESNAPVGVALKPLPSDIKWNEEAASKGMTDSGMGGSEGVGEEDGLSPTATADSAKERKRREMEWERAIEASGDEDEDEDCGRPGCHEPKPEQNQQQSPTPQVVLAGEA